MVVVGSCGCLAVVLVDSLITAIYRIPLCGLLGKLFSVTAFYILKCLDTSKPCFTIWKPGLIV